MLKHEKLASCSELEEANGGPARRPEQLHFRFTRPMSWLTRRDKHTPESVAAKVVKALLGAKVTEGIERIAAQEDKGFNAETKLTSEYGH